MFYTILDEKRIALLPLLKNFQVKNNKEVSFDDVKKRLQREVKSLVTL